MAEVLVNNDEVLVNTETIEDIFANLTLVSDAFKPKFETIGGKKNAKQVQVYNAGDLQTALQTLTVVVSALAKAVKS